MSSECTKPSLLTSLLGKQGVQGAYAQVQDGSSTSNLIEHTQTASPQRYQGVERFVTCVWGGSTVPNLLYIHHCRGNKVCRVLIPFA